MSTAKILVIDDEPRIRLFLTETLTHDGHQVTTTAGGEEALDLIRQESFDLVLLDLQLTGMGGMEVLAALRQQLPDTVVIILTAHASLETAVVALRQGAHDYLFKPCKTVQLRESIRKGLLKRQRELQQRALMHQLEHALTSSLATIQATITELPADTVPEPVPILPAPLTPGGSAYGAETPTVRTQAPPASERGELVITKPAAADGRFLKRGHLLIDFSRHVILVEGHLLELSPTEFDLLAYLISEAPKVVSAQTLIREVQGYTSEAWEASEIIRQHIHSLRKKIKGASGQTDIIRTVRGMGYTISG